MGDLAIGVGSCDKESAVLVVGIDGLIDYGCEVFFGADWLSVDF